MSFNWTSSIQQRYLLAGREEMIQALKLISFLGAILFPGFSILDFFTQYDSFLDLSILRVITSAIFIIMYFIILKGKYTGSPSIAALALVALASMSITLMCLITGGLTSSYYAGIHLIILGVALIFPDPRRLTFGILMTIGIYTCGMLLTPAPEPTLLINNLSFIFASAFIGLSAAVIAEKRKRISFSMYLELEQTKELLQSELLGQQGNIESLTRQLIDQKIDLQKAVKSATTSREEADNALKLREEFISLASHELKTPLTSLKLQTEMAQRKLKGQLGIHNSPINVPGLIENYHAQIRRLARIVDDMLDISRIKSGKLDLQVEPVCLRQLIIGLISRFESHGDKVAVEVCLDENETFDGHWDPFRIEQVILNLLTNAMKYGGGKPIKVSLKRSAQSVLIIVEDQGIGIPRQSLHKIFRKFERAVSPIEYSGLGLGLYLSYKIVQAHAGNILVESEMGKGSKFTVYLPMNSNDTDIDTLINELVRTEA